MTLHWSQEPTPLGLTASGKRRGASKHTGTAEMSLAEIASRLGVSQQAIQQSERRALRKIRKACEDAAATADMTVEEWLRS